MRNDVNRCNILSVQIQTVSRLCAQPLSQDLIKRGWKIEPGIKRTRMRLISRHSFLLTDD